MSHDVEALLATGDDNDALDRLRSELARRAAASGVLDIAYRTLDTPVGALLLAATPDGLVRVAYPREGHDAVLAALAAEVSPRILTAPRRLDDAARQLDDYFAGRRQRFELAVDLRLRSGFRRRVLDLLRQLPYGATVSYGVLAGELGSPRAGRAVGSACATNPVPIVVPCHRVVRGNGAIGGYVGGSGAKALLLELEAGPAQ
jgi:methylated-DNA-[protein]-cysteine S-methyltransferase